MNGFKKIIILSAALSLAACGKGFQSSTNSSSSSNTGLTAPGTTPGDSSGNGNQTDTLPGLDYKGRPVSGGTVAGQDQLTLEIDHKNEAMLLILPIPAQVLPFLGPITTMEFPDLPGAKVISYNSKLTLSVPLKYIVRGAELRDPNFNNLLPNGDRLPAFPAGEGSRFSMTVRNGYVMHLYLGASAVAAYFETPDFDSFLNCQGLPICLPLGPFEIRNEAKTEVLGYVALIAAKQTFHSGVYVASKLSDELARFIDDHIKL